MMNDDLQWFDCKLTKQGQTVFLAGLSQKKFA
jgi:hypothetical protein